jgi:hypothetical protein
MGQLTHIDRGRAWRGRCLCFGPPVGSLLCGAGNAAPAMLRVTVCVVCVLAHSKAIRCRRVPIIHRHLFNGSRHDADAGIALVRADVCAAAAHHGYWPLWHLYILGAADLGDYTLGGRNVDQTCKPI